MTGDVTGDVPGDVTGVAPPDHADVRFPPPALYAGVLLAGAALGRARPLGIGAADDATVRRMAGAVAVGGAVALCGGAVRRFVAAGTSPVPIHPTTALVVTGPYRFTRNPMYLGLTLGTAGIALLTGNGWTLALLVPATFVAKRSFIVPEERYLECCFGDAYRTYRGRVRRWV